MLRYQDYWCGKQIIAPAAARHCSVINCQVPGTRSCRGFDSCRLANVVHVKDLWDLLLSFLGAG